MRYLESQAKSLKKRFNARERPAIKTVVKEAEEIFSRKHDRRLLNYTVDARKFNYSQKQEVMEIE